MPSFDAAASDCRDVSSPSALATRKDAFDVRRDPEDDLRRSGVTDDDCDADDTDDADRSAASEAAAGTGAQATDLCTLGVLLRL